MNIFFAIVATPLMLNDMKKCMLQGEESVSIAK